MVDEISPIENGMPNLHAANLIAAGLLDDNGINRQCVCVCWSSAAIDVACWR